MQRGDDEPGGPDGQDPGIMAEREVTRAVSRGDRPRDGVRKGGLEADAGTELRDARNLVGDTAREPQGAGRTGAHDRVARDQLRIVIRVDPGGNLQRAAKKLQSPARSDDAGRARLDQDLGPACDGAQRQGTLDAEDSRGALVEVGIGIPRLDGHRRPGGHHQGAVQGRRLRGAGRVGRDRDACARQQKHPAPRRGGQGSPRPV